LVEANSVRVGMRPAGTIHSVERSMIRPGSVDRSKARPDGGEPPKRRPSTVRTRVVADGAVLQAEARRN
jgi:hypothetical protein